MVHSPRDHIHSHQTALTNLKEITQNIFSGIKLELNDGKYPQIFVN